MIAENVKDKAIKVPTVRKSKATSQLLLAMNNCCHKTLLKAHKYMQPNCSVAQGTQSTAKNHHAYRRGEYSYCCVA
jgi:hypothetical protein